MIDKETALTLERGDIVHANNGCATKIYKWRAYGVCKTWKRQPNRFRLPIKFGLYQYWEINQDNAYLFHLESECPALRIANTQQSFSYVDVS